MTIKQKKFIAAYIKEPNATKAAKQAYNVKNEPTASQIGYENLRKPEIRDKIRPYLEKHNITIDNALEPISKGLKAKKLETTKNGTYLTEYDDIGTQLQASDRALKLLGITNNTANTQQNLHLHLHKQAEDLDI